MLIILGLKNLVKLIIETIANNYDIKAYVPFCQIFTYTIYK